MARPHIDLPVRFTFTGDMFDVASVEQGTSDEIRNCVLVILACPLGWRDELGDFGSPDPTFGQQPVDPGELAAAVRRWEDRVDVLPESLVDAVDASIARIRLILTER